jgi:hypothetical protein
VWTAAPPVRGGREEWVLLLPKDEPIKLRRTSGGTVGLYAAQRFVILPDDLNEGEYKTQTREYIYHLSDDAAALLEWHWHPGQKTEPHLHSRIPGAGSAWEIEGDKLHLPTSRVAFEDIIRFLITDLGVKPARDDWEALLDEAMRAFLRWRRWPRGSTPEARTSPSREEPAPKKSRKARG